MTHTKNIFVAGHRGMVGQALMRQLGRDRKNRLIVKTRTELDLTNQAAVQTFLQSTPIDEIYIAAAKVGGIYANNQAPADFIVENLGIELNLIAGAFSAGITKILFLGSSCIYPKFSPQPIPESALLTGTLEPTNEPYAIAKIAGIKLCESFNRQYRHQQIDYRSVMPTNLYGPGDNYHPQNSHVLPALIRRFHEAKENCANTVTVWGSGQARREFLHVDDLAKACVLIQNIPKTTYDELTGAQQSHINIGYGEDITIRELAHLVADTVGFKGEVLFDNHKPDGAPRKWLNSALINTIGFTPSIDIRTGLKTTYADYLHKQINPTDACLA